jgi:hypothetical protein
MTTSLRLLGTLAILALPVAAGAQVEFNDTQQVLTLHGTVAADRKGAEKIGYDGISIGFTGAPADVLCWIGVVEADAAGGDAFLGRDIIASLDGYTPNLLASGRASVLATLRNAPAGSRVLVSGIVDQSARTFLVASVKVTPAASR